MTVIDWLDSWSCYVLEAIVKWNSQRKQKGRRK